MRQWLAWKLVQLAAWIHNAEHRDQFEIVDDYGISRCVVSFLGDEYGCTVTNVSADLPEGWEWHAAIDGLAWH